MAVREEILGASWLMAAVLTPLGTNAGDGCPWGLYSPFNSFSSLLIDRRKGSMPLHGLSVVG